MADKINIKLDGRVLRVPADTEMDTKLLSSLIAKHKELVSKVYKPLDDAYKGDYSIFHLPAKASWKPDNRIAVNFAKYISDTFNGFFIGIPMKASSDSENEAVGEYLEFLDGYNNQDNNNAELSKLSNNFGTAYEMYYTDEDGESGITYLSPMEAFMVYDDSILSRPLFFVRYIKGADGVERGSYSDAKYIQHFENRGGVRWTDQAYEHHFCDVPATEYVHNAERMGIYEDSLSSIDAFNKALSEKANDIEYFSDAYLKVVGPRVSEDDARYIRSNRIINLYEDPQSAGESRTMDASFLAKPDADGSQEHLLDRLHQLIFQLSMVVNISDESFGTASGIALKYKLTAMYNLFRVKARKFTAGVNRRYRLLFSSPIAQTHGVAADDWISVKAAFTPNFPANISDEADVVMKLDGVVSRETQLSLLSCVDDVMAEIGRINEEQEERLNQDDSYRDFIKQTMQKAAEGSGDASGSDGES